MHKKIIFISEVFSRSLDEGLKTIIFNLFNVLKEKSELCAVTRNENAIVGDDIIKIRLNKLFLGHNLHSRIKFFSPDAIIYIPEASTTLNGFLRAKILRLCHPGIPVCVIGSQPREYSACQKIILGNFKIDILFLLGGAQKYFFEDLGFNVKVLPPAIDVKKFHPVNQEKKDCLRRKYAIQDNFVVLHVGHIKQNRNIEQLIDVQGLRNIQVIIVSSATTKVDYALKRRLKESGIKVYDSYISTVEEIYQLADLYVFPVIKQDAAIEMPLSVLEAMACNLPVITTRFGGLVECFKENEGFRYFANNEELLDLIPAMGRLRSTNTEKVADFTWENMANFIISAIEELK